MRLAFVLFNYFPYGGLQRDFLRIATLCQQRGHQIQVFTMQWEGEQPHWMSVELIKAQGISNHRRAKDFARQVYTLTRQHYDKVIGFNKMPGLDIYYAADSCFITRPQYQHQLLKRLTTRYRTYQQLESAVFSSSTTTTILLISKPEMMRYQHLYHTPQQQLHLLPPGINKAFIRPENYQTLRAQLRTEFRVADDEFMLLSVASHFRTKGLDYAIRAIKMLPFALRIKVKLLIAGADESKQCRRLAAPLREQVFFLGARNDIPHLMFAADLLLHFARLDNTGTVILEALVAGLPVLATAQCGYASYVEEAKAGSVISSPFQLAQATRLLQQALNFTQLEQWQSQALEYSRTHDLFSLFDQAISWIEA